MTLALLIPLRSLARSFTSSRRHPVDVLEAPPDARRDAAIVEGLDRTCRVDLSFRWRAACEYSGLARAVATPLGGQHLGRIPQVVHVEVGGYDEPTFLIVKLAHGQTIDDLEMRREVLAQGLGAWGARFESRGGDFVRVDVITADPLAGVVPFSVSPGEVVFGRDEVGRLLSLRLDELTNAGIQGSTGSGKSAAAYNLLAQLRACGPLVDVVGLDPTGLLLGPWGDHPHGWRVCGTRDGATRYPVLLRELVDDMDRRIENLPPRCDALPITPATPLRVVVLEELAAISRLTGYSTSKPSETQRLIGRLASEGRKGGYRLLIIGQRLGSDVLSTDTRDQLLTRMTFGCRDLATVKMLSPDANPEDLAELVDSPSGVALAELPGSGLIRLRGPWIGGYGDYCDAVSGSLAA